MTRTAVFRADATHAIGGGHIYRCLALADILKLAGWNCIFACRAGAEETVPMLARSAHGRLSLDSPAESTRLRQLHPRGIDLLVVDHYSLGADFESACRPWARTIMVLDDFPGRRHDCDILLDQNLGADENQYRGQVPNHCRLLLGSRYALLRPQFAAARREALRRRTQGVPARRLLVSLGATDPLNATPVIVAAAAGLQLELDVVLGESSKQGGAILELARGLGISVRVHGDVADMAALMVSADIAAGAGGSTSWERCCLGLPTLLVVTAENQSMVAQKMAEEGIAETLGPASTLEPVVVARALRGLAESPERLAAMSCKAFLACDGMGAGRVAAQIAPALTITGGAVTLRPAVKDDCRLVWDWQNEPQMRAYFRNPQVPGWIEHRDWFGARLADPQAAMCIIELDGKACGLLRLDPHAVERQYEISILVSMSYQGQGIGTAALKLAPLLVPWADLLADIKADNAQSQRAFRAAGFEDGLPGYLVLGSRLGKKNG